MTTFYYELAPQCAAKFGGLYFTSSNRSDSFNRELMLHSIMAWKETDRGFEVVKDRYTGIVGQLVATERDIFWIKLRSGHYVDL